MSSQSSATFFRLVLIVIISLARDPLLNFGFDGFAHAVEVTRSGALNGPMDKCYLALKHNESQSVPATAHNSTSTETIDDSNVISARLLTIDPFETSNRVVTLDNGKDCKIAVLLLVKECKFASGSSPVKWDPQKSPKFKNIFSMSRGSRYPPQRDYANAKFRRRSHVTMNPARSTQYLLERTGSFEFPQTPLHHKNQHMKRDNNPKSEITMEEPTTDHLITYKGSGCQSDYYIQLYGPTAQS